MVEQRTAQANQARSLAAEQGIEIPVCIHILQQRLPDIIEDAEQLISPVLRQLLFSLLENIHSLNERILSAEHCLAALCQQQPKYKVLMTIPGIGPLIAAAFLSEVNAEQFVDSIGQRNSHVKTWGCGGFLNETNIYSKRKSICF